MRQIIGFHYTLKNDAGQVLDSTNGGHPMLYLAGSGQVLIPLDNELQKMEVGERKTLSFDAKNAYGEINPALKMNVKLRQFPTETDVKPGLRFRINNEPGSPMFRVLNVLGEEVFIDGNHEMAGVNVSFDVEITEKREATKDEIAHNHAHGVGGVQH